MTEFIYEALDKGGKHVRGMLEAANEEVIYEKLRDMGFYPIDVRPRRRKTAAQSDLLALPILRQLFHRIKSRHIMAFTRQLATLIDAGLPILRSLAILREQTESVLLRDRIGVMAADIEAGQSLSDAMARHPRVFDKLYVNMVRAGELGGVLEQVLDRVAQYLEKREELKGKVRAALMYPLVVLTLAVAIVTFILIVIIPRFETMFEQLQGQMPLPTQVLIDTSKLIAHNVWLPVAAVIALVVLMSQMNRHQNTKYVLDLAKLRMPVFGDLFRKIAIARFAGTLSTLINAGVPILQALDIVRDSSGNEVVARATARVHQNVKDGETIHEPLAECHIFPPLVVHMVAVGEETGAIDHMLTKVAEAYEREVDDTVNALTSILEPVLIVCLGGLVGAIVVCLYLPIFSIPDMIPAG